MLANIVEKWCLRGWYKNQKIPDLCGGAEQLRLLQPGDSGQTPGTILIATSTLHESTFPAWWEDVFCLLFAFFSNIRPRLEKKREEFLRLSGISGNIKTHVQSNYDCLMRFWTRTS
ncbi:hypothetical protein [Endozoicomonas sp. SCSIO W0465]|uniref:hypothetical protein n=1 Tax=Endozoicomonas sp. SCSIO W0465 TaxID=2918516 RepID=UPI002074F459|nr:hypothetical protein [Endozoicomonas sp. SCSIO W0465]USE35698.1 hypothetical protein MJO57_27120 [Endozoicomonas sp. SCSIO W0465]